MTQGERSTRIGLGWAAGGAAVLAVGYLFYRNAKHLHATPMVAAVLGGIIVGPMVGWPVLGAIAGDAMLEDTAERLRERDAQFAEIARMRASFVGRDGAIA